MKRGQEITLEVRGLSSRGLGVGRVDGRVVFVERAIPGETVRAKVLKKKSSHLRARKIELITPSPHEVLPDCAHFGECGGCAFMNLDYTVQLEQKASLVMENLKKIAGLSPPPVEEPEPSPSLYEYRNKMEFTFSPLRWVLETEPEGVDNHFGLGLLPRGRFDKAINITRCRIAPEVFSTILNETRRLARATGLPPYDTRTHEGVFRFLVIRRSEATGEVMAVLVTSPEMGSQEAAEEIAGKLRRDVPELTTFIHGTSSLKAQVARWQEERVLFGPGAIREKIGDFRFTISPASFFQTNTEGAQKLFDKVERALDGRRFSHAFDLYCGTGSFAMLLSRFAERVTGFELLEEAVSDARKNAAENSIENVEFVACDLDGFFRDPGGLAERYGRPEIILADPPRAGMHPKVAKGVLGLSPERIVYVSCNPATLARDIGVLLDEYVVDAVQPVDMFPHTPHVEAVAILRKRG